MAVATASSCADERRWQPPNEGKSGQYPLKASPGRNQQLLQNSNTTESETGHPAQTGAFSVAAVDLRQRGLYPIPLLGPDHRTPGVNGFTKHRWQPCAATIERQIKRFPDASVGVVTGWMITVVDVDSDDPAILCRVLERFGDAVIRIRTPRGGWHLYYRHNGERCANLRREGLPVDVKARGGFVVAPPSVRVSGQNAGRAYYFEKGSWDDLARLRPIKAGALPVTSRAPVPSTGAGSAAKSSSAGEPALRRGTALVQPLGAVSSGWRNNTLYRALLRHAPTYRVNFAGLVGVGRAIVRDQFISDPADPFTDAEITKTAGSAWRCEIEGRNRVGRKAWPREFDPLAAHPNGTDAAALLRVLRHLHGARDGRGEAWAASPKAMAKAATIPGWSRHGYRRSLAVLVDLGFLTIVHRGGRRRGDARKFRFSIGEGPKMPSPPEAKIKADVLKMDQQFSCIKKYLAEHDRVTVSQVAHDVLSIEHPGTADQRRIASALDQLGWQAGKRTKTARWWIRNAPVDDAHVFAGSAGDAHSPGDALWTQCKIQTLHPAAGAPPQQDSEVRVEGTASVAAIPAEGKREEIGPIRKTAPAMPPIELPSADIRNIAPSPPTADDTAVLGCLHMAWDGSAHRLCGLPVGQDGIFCRGHSGWRDGATRRPKHDGARDP